jgi:hypothetical protein
VPSIVITRALVSATTPSGTATSYSTASPVDRAAPRFAITSSSGFSKNEVPRVHSRPLLSRVQPK